MKKYLLIFLAFAGSAIGCKEAEKKQEEAKEPTQMERVVAIHDEVMPKMGMIGKLMTQLEPKIDSTETGMKHQKAKEALQDAHDTMMQWMQGFGDRFDSDEVLYGKELTPEKQRWLDEEEVKVKVMRDKVIGSIENAEALLGNSDK